MGHCTPATPKPATSLADAATAERTGTAVIADTGALPYPRVDYGFGSDAMAGMDHGAMGHDGMAMPILGR